jgi:hypothetical protein
MDDLLTELLEMPAPASDPPSGMSFAERMEKATAQMTDLFDERTQGKNVWLIVCTDATSSMEEKFRQTCGAVMSMFRALRNDLGCTLQVAVVAYRDPMDNEDDTNDTFEFTHKQIVFQNQMKDIKCRGGGDESEDMAGGLALVVDRLKEVPRSDAAIVCHITDAPAHGVAGSINDHHDTDAQRDALATQLRAIRDHAPEDFEYLYFPVGERATYVSNLHRAFVAQHLGPDWVHTYMRACKTNDFELCFASSVFESVTSSHAALSSSALPVLDVLGLGTSVGDDGAEDKRLGLLRASVRDVHVPTDTKAFVRDLTGYAKPPATEVSFLGSFMGFSRHMAPPPTPLAHSTNTVLEVHGNPMGRGAEHYVYKAKMWRDVEEGKLAAMDTDVTAFESLGRSSSTCPMVVKVPRVVQLPGFAESKMAVHVPAMVFADLFNTFASRLGWTDVPEIRVAAPTVVSFPEEDVRLKKPSQGFFVKTKKLREHVLVAEKLLPGDFVKMWDNAGRRNSAAFDRIQQLKVLYPYVLLCYVLSDQSYVPSDLQGTLDRSSTRSVLTLTDLAATCVNPLAFQESRTNLGEPVLRKMVHEAYVAFKDDRKFAELFGPSGLLKDKYTTIEAVMPMKKPSKKRARA